MTARFKLSAISLQSSAKKGFSLIEILVAISIIVLLGIIAIPNLKQFSKDQEIDSVAVQVLNALKTAQSQAASRIKCPNGESSLNWKISLAAQNYSLIATCESITQTIFTNPYSPASPATSDTYSGSVDVCSIPPPVEIIFSGNQISYLCNGSATTNTGNILLTITGSSGATKTVKIESGGVIKIE